MIGSKGIDYEEMSIDIVEGIMEIEFFGDFDEVGGGIFIRCIFVFVDFGKYGVGGLRNNGGGEIGYEIGIKVGDGLYIIGYFVFGELMEDSFRDFFEGDEFGYGIRDFGK